jgi:hypothetical protein
MLPIILRFVREQGVEAVGIPLSRSESYLAAMQAGGGQVAIRDHLGVGVYLQGNLEGFDLELGRLGVVTAGAGVVPAGGAQSRYPSPFAKGVQTRCRSCQTAGLKR